MVPLSTEVAMGAEFSPKVCGVPKLLGENEDNPGEKPNPKEGVNKLAKELPGKRSR